MHFLFLFFSHYNLHIKNVERDDIENDLDFLCFFILENELKKQTVPSLKELHNANIRTLMVTGDNLSTAVAIARKEILPNPNLTFN